MATGSSSGERRVCWAVTVPGLEHLARAELQALGLAPREPEPGGVAFETDDAGVYLANLQLRTVTRVLVRVDEFRATAFHQLERLARKVRWETYVAPGKSVELRVTCKKSRLYHSDAVAARLFDAVTLAVPGARITKAGERDDEDASSGEAQLFVVRFFHDICTISVDSSGAPLYRRGYRLATAKAPIRETLAAAVLLSLSYDGSAPLMDPMCGSGTFAIEGALIARHHAPGLARSFACERWPGAPATLFSAAHDAAQAAVLPRAPASIVASDRDAGAIVAAEANAARAGVTSDIELVQRTISAIEPSQSPGLLVVNPPYGDRIGEHGSLRDLYARLGDVARSRCPGWKIAMVSADRTLEAQAKLPFTEALRFKNGGIPVRAVQAKVPPSPDEPQRLR